MKLRGLLLAALGLAAAAGVAWGQDEGSDGEARAIQWRQKPDGRTLQRIMPNEALVQGRDGGALLECTLSRNGWLKQCQVLSETEPGLGFAQAALGVSVYFKFTSPDGHDLSGEQVRIPINWSVEGPMDGIRHDVITGPVWLKAPTRAEVAAAYPAGAHGDGRVLFECQVNRHGGLDVCKLQGKASDKGFEAAARRLLPSFRSPTAAEGGRSLVGAHVFVPIQLLEPNSPDAVDSPIGNRPIWQALPEAAQLAFPEAARAKGLQRGRAEVDCLVGPFWALTDCRVVKETPEGAGFGDAALAAAAHFALSAWSFDGRPVEGYRIRLPIGFVDGQAASS
jgi:hypothetical protein